MFGLAAGRAWLPQSNEPQGCWQLTLRLEEKGGPERLVLHGRCRKKDWKAAQLRYVTLNGRYKDCQGCEGSNQPRLPWHHKKDFFVAFAEREP